MLQDSIWQVMLHSSETGFGEDLYTPFSDVAPVASSCALATGGVGRRPVSKA